MSERTPGLIERLENSMGPDRVLDCLIALEVGFEGDILGGGIVKCAIDYPDDLATVARWHDVPEYTKSIDAALTLIPTQEELGLSICFDVSEMKWEAFVTAWAHGETIALAVCIAALKARAALLPVERDQLTSKINSQDGK